MSELIEENGVWYRMLKPGETVRKGDEYEKDGDPWCLLPEEVFGGMYGGYKGFRVRRPVYRLLKNDEDVIQEGDEVCHVISKTRQWVLLGDNTFGNPVDTLSLSIRRPIPEPNKGGNDSAKWGKNGVIENHVPDSGISNHKVIQGHKHCSYACAETSDEKDADRGNVAEQNTGASPSQRLSVCWGCEGTFYVGNGHKGLCKFCCNHSSEQNTDTCAQVKTKCTHPIDIHPELRERMGIPWRVHVFWIAGSDGQAAVRFRWSDDEGENIESRVVVPCTRLERVRWNLLEDPYTEARDQEAQQNKQSGRSKTALRWAKDISRKEVHVGYDVQYGDGEGL